MYLRTQITKPGLICGSESKPFMIWFDQWICNWSITVMCCHADNKPLYKPKWSKLYVCLQESRSVLVYLPKSSVYKLLSHFLFYCYCCQGTRYYTHTAEDLTVAINISCFYEWKEFIWKNLLNAKVFLHKNGTAWEIYRICFPVCGQFNISLLNVRIWGQIYRLVKEHLHKGVRITVLRSCRFRLTWLT